MPTKSLVHLNNHIMVAIDLETTGLRAGFHEIIQIAMIPLDNNLEPRKDLPIFDQKIRPEYPNRIDDEALNVSKVQMADILNHGISADQAEVLFEYWFNKLGLAEGKRIVPLGSNIAQFDLKFIEAWLKHEAFKQYFSGHARDVMLAAAFLNDVSDFNAEQTPFNKYKLIDIARKLDVEVISGMTHDAVYDAWLSAQCYKKMLTHHLLELSHGVPM
jgi:DNA polymerase III epsilon subunit-like protein